MTESKFRQIERRDPLFAGAVAVFWLANKHYELKNFEIERVVANVVDWCDENCNANGWKVSLFDYEVRVQDHLRETDHYAVTVSSVAADVFVSFQDEGEAANFLLAWS